MSLANGNVSSEEAKWIGKIGSAIGLSKETIKGIITETKEAAKRADEEARRSQLESILAPNPDYKPSRRAREAATNETSDDVAWGRGVVTWVVILALIAFLVWIFVLTPLWGKIYLACAAVTYLVCRLGGRRNGQSLLIAAIGPVALALVLMAIVSFSDSQRKK